MLEKKGILRPGILQSGKEKKSHWLNLVFFGPRRNGLGDQDRRDHMKKLGWDQMVKKGARARND